MSRRTETAYKAESLGKSAQHDKTLATHSGMTNQWLKDQGVLSVKDLWVKIHYPATAR
jgi:hypothetical protein